MQGNIYSVICQRRFQPCVLTTPSSRPSHPSGLFLAPNLRPQLSALSPRFFGSGLHRMAAMTFSILFRLRSRSQLPQFSSQLEQMDMIVENLVSILSVAIDRALAWTLPQVGDPGLRTFANTATVCLGALRPDGSGADA